MTTSWNIFRRDDARTWPRQPGPYLFATFNPNCAKPRHVEMGFVTKGRGVCMYASRWYTHWCRIPHMPKLSNARKAEIQAISDSIKP